MGSAILRYLALVSLRDVLARPDDWTAETSGLLDCFRAPVSDSGWLDILSHSLTAARSADAGRATPRALDAALVNLFFDVVSVERSSGLRRNGAPT